MCALHRLKYVSPWHPDRSHTPQQQLLEIKTDGPGITQASFISGRGGGKTAVAVMKVLRTCISDPDTVGLVLAPTVKMLERSFLREWKAMVPSALYKHKVQEQKVELINGACFYFSTRNIDNPSRGKDVTRGLTVDWVVDDESALGFDSETYSNTMACVRGHGKHHFYFCFTTPRINEFRDLVESEDYNHVVQSTSYNNPFNPDWFVENVRSAMSTQQAKREIDGQWVELEGLVWPDWSFSPWPNGNVHQHTFQPGRPWYLFLDLGSATAAYIVCQLVSAGALGQGLSNSDIWVATHELLPSTDGSAERAFRLLKERFGPPVMVVGGADLTTRASTDGKKATFFTRKIFGQGTVVKPIVGWMADKEIQHAQLSASIRDYNGYRRFCISKKFETIGYEKGRAKRGIKQLVEQDVWPDNAGRQRSLFLAKEGRLEHVRDALLYGAVGIIKPPRFTRD